MMLFNWSPTIFLLIFFLQLKLSTFIDPKYLNSYLCSYLRAVYGNVFVDILSDGKYLGPFGTQMPNAFFSASSKFPKGHFYRRQNSFKSFWNRKSTMNDIKEGKKLYTYMNTRCDNSLVSQRPPTQYNQFSVEGHIPNNCKLNCNPPPNPSAPSEELTAPTVESGNDSVFRVWQWLSLPEINCNIQLLRGTDFHFTGIFSLTSSFKRPICRHVPRLCDGRVRNTHILYLTHGKRRG